MHQLNSLGAMQLFLADQRKFPVPNEEELQELEIATAEQEQEKEKLQAAFDEAQKKNVELSSTLSDTDLKVSLETANNVIARLKERLQEVILATGSDSLTGSLDKTTLEKILKKCQAAEKKRKR